MIELKNLKDNKKEGKKTIQKSPIMMPRPKKSPRMWSIYFVRLLFFVFFLKEKHKQLLITLM